MWMAPIKNRDETHDTRMTHVTRSSGKGMQMEAHPVAKQGRRKRRDRAKKRTKTEPSQAKHHLSQSTGSMSPVPASNSPSSFSVNILRSARGTSLRSPRESALACLRHLPKVRLSKAREAYSACRFFCGSRGGRKACQLLRGCHYRVLFLFVAVSVSIRHLSRTKPALYGEGAYLKERASANDVLGFKTRAI